MSEPVLELKEVTLRRGRFSLEGVNLSLAGGEILALLGRTGAGKTLLLESAAGFCAPSGGQVLFRGQEVRSIPLHRRNIGYLYQEYSLFPHLTAAQNIGYGLRVRHMRRDEVHRQVQQLAARFGLERVLDQYPGTLSGGEQQRVALARALAPRPALLLLDEPFSALDPVTKKQLHGLLRRIRQEFGCAVLFVTHDFTEAQDLADRVGVLAGGRLCGIAPAADLYRASWPAPALEFLGLRNKREEKQPMTQTQLYERLKKEFARIVAENGLAEEPVAVRCRALTPEEAIGNTRRTDFPILEGKDVMIQAEYRGSRGQAFTDAPAAFSGTLAQVLALDILQDAHARGLFIACLNAVMAHLGRCTGTVHCRTQGPEQCAVDMHAWLDTEYPNARRVGLVGYQPALLEMLAGSGRQVRVLDLNPENVGAARFGVRVEDGARAREDLIQWADLILCTGSTLCNGTLVDYMELPVPVVFFGITLAGSAELLGLRRVCFADRYE